MSNYTTAGNIGGVGSWMFPHRLWIWRLAAALKIIDKRNPTRYIVNIDFLVRIQDVVRSAKQSSDLSLSHYVRLSGVHG